MNGRGNKARVVFLISSRP